MTASDMSHVPEEAMTTSITEIPYSSEELLTTTAPIPLGPSISAALAATLKGVREGVVSQSATVTLTRTEQGKLQEIMARPVPSLSGTLTKTLTSLTVGDIPTLDKHMVGIYQDLVNMKNVEVTLRNAVEGAKSKAKYTHWKHLQDDYMNESLSGNLSLQKLSTLIEAMEKHFEERRNIAIPTSTIEVQFHEKIEFLCQQKDTLQRLLDEDLTSKFDILLNSLALKLSQILFSSSLPTIYDEQVYKALTALTVVMSPATKIAKEQELRGEIAKRQGELEKEENAIKLKKEQEQNAHRIAIRYQMQILSENVSIQTTIESLEKMRDSGSISTDIRNLINKLSSQSEKNQREDEMIEIFESAISKLRIKKTSNGYVELTPDVKLKIFEPELPVSLKWQVKYKLVDGMVNIFFEDSVAGKRINPHGGIDNHQNAKQVWDPNYPLRVTESEFREMMKYVKKGASAVYEALQDEKVADHAKKYGYLARILHRLPKTNIDARPRVPTFPSTATIGPTALTFFKTFEELAQIQISSGGEGNGIIKIEGDAGTGKNYKIDMYAAMTNREVFEMSGNRTATKGDLLFTHEIGPDGTYRASSDLIRGIQTPGSIIVLDEINAYPPEVIKLLNPLTDGRRSINDPQKGKIKCHPSVIICSASNPSHYIGTAPFPMELKSRARDINDKYPDLHLPDGKISWEEAETLRQHAHKVGLAKMSHEEFVQRWDATFVQNPPVWEFDNTMQDILTGIFHLLKFSKDMRKIYQNTCAGFDGAEFHYPINLRDNIQIIYEYERGGHSFKEATLNVLRPKVSGKDIDVEEERILLVKKIDEYFR